MQKISTNGSQSHLKFKIENAAKMAILRGLGQENGCPNGKNGMILVCMFNLNV